MKKLSILGSTGSIGKQTLEIVRQFPNEFKVVGLTANTNIELLKQQIEEFKPEAVAVANFAKADEFKAEIPVYKGLEGLKKIATLESADTVVNSLVGSIGVLPTISAINSKKHIALANKETLVTAGDIVMKAVKENNITLMPIDSEHSAIFQCINCQDINTVKRIIITCSGGAFKNHTKEQLQNVTAEDALKHPTWNMGAKITIDCATLMNKGFEVIEAHHLYKMPYEKIDVILHPQSIIHSLVEFNDNSVIAQHGMPSMKIPIQYALTYPKRLENPGLPRLEFSDLTFKHPDLALFPCLQYAYSAGKAGGSMPAVLNAANEVAVHAFLNSQIKFLDIPNIIKQMMDAHTIIQTPDLDELIDLDNNIRVNAKKLISEAKE